MRGNDFDHAMDLILLAMTVVGGLFMWRTDGWMMAATSIMFTAGWVPLFAHLICRPWRSRDAE